MMKELLQTKHKHKHKEKAVKTRKTTLSVQNDVLSIIGIVQFNSVMALYKEGKKIIDTMENVTIDLQRLEHCDSSGLALCTAWMREAAAQKKSIVFSQIPLFMQDLIRVYGLDSVLPLKMVV